MKELKCDICGGNLIMQSIEKAKCGSCGMEYPKHILIEKLNGAQEIIENKVMQNDSIINDKAYRNNLDNLQNKQHVSMGYEHNNNGPQEECSRAMKLLTQDKEKGVQLLNELVAKGNVFAMNMYAGMCFNGNYVEKDIQKAASLYKQSAEQGNIIAQYYSGVCYENGYGVELDKEKAVYWYKKAAEKGNVYAQSKLGEIYEQFGEIVEKAKGDAFGWYLKAAEQGYAQAQYNVGVCYARGIGIDVDKKKSRYWLEQSASRGNEQAKEIISKLNRGVDLFEVETQLHELEQIYSEGIITLEEYEKLRHEVMGYTEEAKSIAEDTISNINKNKDKEAEKNNKLFILAIIVVVLCIAALALYFKNANLQTSKEDMGRVHDDTSGFAEEKVYEEEPVGYADGWTATDLTNGDIDTTQIEDEYADSWTATDLTNGDIDTTQIEDIIFYPHMDLDSVITQLFNSKYEITDFYLSAYSTKGNGLESYDLFEMGELLNKYTDSMGPDLKFKINGCNVSIMFGGYNRELIQLKSFNIGEIHLGFKDASYVKIAGLDKDTLLSLKFDTDDLKSVNEQMHNYFPSIFFEKVILGDGEWDTLRYGQWISDYTNANFYTSFDDVYGCYRLSGAGVYYYSERK